jgi:rhodanese-related sulfurtransferase/DNA-binding transcriptional regulator YhcF (GntR family)
MDDSAKREFKDQLYEQFERVAQALASARRLELLDLLAQGERSVEALAAETGMSVANTSRHLQILRTAQIVEVRREGSYIFYRLADERVFRVCAALRELAEVQLAEIDRIVQTFLKDRNALDGVGVAELRRRLKDGGVVVLDVRPEGEYRAGHIAGARSVPLAELEARLREIPKDQEVVAYCRGPYCVFADEAVALLRAHGYRARRFEMGFPDWKARGLPVEGESGGPS